MAPTRAPRRRTRLGRLASLLLLPATLLTAACDPGALSVGGGSSGRVEVALLVPTGDPNPQIAAIGASLSRAANLAVTDAGTDLVNVTTYSTGGTQARAVAAAQEAMANGASVIVGPFYSANAAAVSRAVAGNGLAVISFSNNSDIAGGNLFTFGFTVRNIADQLGRYAASRGQRRIMIVHGRTPEEEIMRNAAIAGLSGTGATVVGTADFEFSQDGIAAALPSIAAQARDSGAEALMLTSSTQGALPVLSSRMRDVGLGPDSVQSLGLTRWNVPPSAVSLPGLQGGWFTLPDPEGTSRFTTRYSEGTGTSPHSLAVLAYDAINAMAVQAKRSGPAGVTPAGLVRGGSFAGAAGTFRFRSDGQVQRGLAIATIENNSVRILRAAPSRLGAAGS